MSEELDDLIQGFVEESQEAFEAIENDLLQMEDNPEDLTIINGIFRVLHTIKGTAGFMGLDDVSHLSHQLESIFDQVRKEEITMTPELMDRLLPSLDLLKLMVFELVGKEKSDYQLPETLELLKKILDAGGGSGVEIDISGQGQPAKPAAQEAAVEDIAISPELLQDFVVEAEEHLEVIEQELLTLEKDPEDNNAINEIFRATHSIKGTASYVNLTKITELSHKMETCFDRIRKGSARYTNEMADIILKGLDILKSMIALIKMKEDYSIFDIVEVCNQLEPFIEGASEKPKKPEVKKAPAGEPTVEDQQFKALLNLGGQQVLSIQALGAELIAGKAEPDDLMVLHRSLKTLDNGVKKSGLEIVYEQSHALEELVVALLAEEVTAEDASPAFQEHLGQLVEMFDLMKELGRKGFEQAFNAGQPMGAKTKVVTKKDREAQDKQAQAQAKAESAVQKDDEIKTMRIDAFRLDSFMNLIGELIIARNSLNHTLGEIPSSGVPGEVMASLRQVEGAFNRISEDLQGTLMEMRLLPVKTVFQKIPRIIRDISRKTDKIINLQMVGENTLIDKSIIEVLGDPLVHIIRNSCDHGIESKADRMKAGKPEAGNIILKASPRGGSIVIEIIDDGAGINTKKVLEKAISKGLVRSDQASALDAKTINAFVFHPGFSTADQVSDLSGRGVGMDVVMTNIHKVHGMVDVESEMGNGTQISLILPLTLSVIDALLIVDHGQQFAIPLESVKESIEVKMSDLHQLKNKEAINLRGDVIGVSRLSHLLGKERTYSPDAVVSIVFIHVGARIMGLVVDDLTNQQEIVVKPLQQYLTSIPGISGSTILGSGDIILILDPSELIDLSSQ